MLPNGASTSYEKYKAGALIRVYQKQLNSMALMGLNKFLVIGVSFKPYKPWPKANVEIVFLCITVTSNQRFNITSHNMS